MIPQAVETKQVRKQCQASKREIRYTQDCWSFMSKCKKIMGAKIQERKSLRIQASYWGEESASSPWIPPPLSLWLGYDFGTGESEYPETQKCMCRQKVPAPYHSFWESLWVSSEVADSVFPFPSVQGYLSPLSLRLVFLHTTATPSFLA